MATIKTIWTSNFDEMNYLEGFLENIGLAKEAYDTCPKVYESDLWEYADMEVSIEYSDMLANINSHEEMNGAKMYVVRAKLGLWNGTFAGGRIITGMGSVICACQEDYTTIYLKNRQMIIDAVHHDGTNNFEIKELTKEGERFYERNKDKLSDRDMVESLFNDHHKSRHVSIWRDMYGM